MKKLTILATAAAAVLAINATAETRIAVIDIEKIVDLHPDTKHNREILRDTVKDYQGELDSLESSVLAARKAASAAIDESRNPALGDKARQKAEEEAAKKIEAARNIEREYAEKRSEHQKSLNETELRMLRLTVRQIEAAIKEYAKANGLTAVLPSSGSRLGIAPAVLWADDSIDITAAIMDKLGLVESQPEPEAGATGDAAAKE